MAVLSSSGGCCRCSIAALNFGRGSRRLLGCTGSKLAQLRSSLSLFGTGLCGFWGRSGGQACRKLGSRPD